jgi:hypothetical protein
MPHPSLLVIFGLILNTAGSFIMLRWQVLPNAVIRHPETRIWYEVFGSTNKQAPHWKVSIAPEEKTHAKTPRREEKTYTLIRLCQAEEQNSELCYLWFLLFKFVLAIFCSFASLREVLTSLVAAWSLCFLLFKFFSSLPSVTDPREGHCSTTRRATHVIARQYTLILPLFCAAS